MFYRDALKYLQKWKVKKDRKPLVIRGARQVGKTTLVNMFSSNFKQYIYLNLEISEERKIFENKNNFDQVIDALFFLKNATKAQPDTLFIY